MVQVSRASGDDEARLLLDLQYCSAIASLRQHWLRLRCTYLNLFPSQTAPPFREDALFKLGPSSTFEFADSPPLQSEYELEFEFRRFPSPRRFLFDLYLELKLGVLERIQVSAFTFNRPSSINTKIHAVLYMLLFYPVLTAARPSTKGDLSVQT
ncbi:hypothetical protein BT96DRAFT_996519 [Gymnopus androsaceus JB14]|uniref:Uncharacterized protein n=1 Tax=Gymnopus androsaceus JB14 TaxID=1447944 RepID=A0A6A4HHI8_9AGAR|nr:hypothetical protein BT96DRAFT_996519 [Gymnopus androsaceus JB14]